MIWDALKLSLLVVAFATVIVAVLGILFSFLLSKFEFRGKELLDAVLTMPLVLPPTVTGYYLIVLLGRHGLIGGGVVVLGRQGVLGGFIYDLTGWTVVFTWQGAVVAAVVVALPLMIKASRASIE